MTGRLTIADRVPEKGDVLMYPDSECTDWVALYDVLHIGGGGITVRARSLDTNLENYPVPLTIQASNRWRYFSRADGGKVTKKGAEE